MSPNAMKQPDKEETTVQPSVQKTTSQPEIVIGLPTNTTSSTDKAFLGKVMAAVGIELSKCAVKPVEQNEETSDLLDALPEASTLLLFGTHSAMTLAHYQVIRKESHRLLAADNLSKIQADQSKKRQLWEGLKQLFK